MEITMRGNFRLQVRRIYCVDRPPIENGFVQVVDGLVTDLGHSSTPSDQTIDLGPVAIIPGLVNAHTHLEFSLLQQPLGEPGIPFTQWIKEVVSCRTALGKHAQSKARAIASGIVESRESGVIALGEIATLPIAAKDYGQGDQITVFLESLGRDAERVEATAQSAANWLRAFSSTGGLVPGISPHAPYSVHPRLMERLIQQSQHTRCPLAMHLAETPEELQLLSDQTGPFVELLVELNAWFPDSYTPGTQVLDYLKMLSRAHRALIVHGNYLADNDIAYLADHAENMSVVFCPRTHQYFRHAPYPLLALLDAGIQVAVGTDSRASNPDLHLFEELRLIANDFPQLESDAILSMGTRAGAIALGLDNEQGTIQIGSVANFNVVQSDGGDLFEPGSRCLPVARFLQQG